MYWVIDLLSLILNLLHHCNPSNIFTFHGFSTLFCVQACHSRFGHSIWGGDLNIKKVTKYGWDYEVFEKSFIDINQSITGQMSLSLPPIRSYQYVAQGKQFHLLLHVHLSFLGILFETKVFNCLTRSFISTLKRLIPQIVVNLHTVNSNGVAYPVDWHISIFLYSSCEAMTKIIQWISS